jgi:hypothetical protein
MEIWDIIEEDELLIVEPFEGHQESDRALDT